MNQSKKLDMIQESHFSPIQHLSKRDPILKAIFHLIRFSFEDRRSEIKARSDTVLFLSWPLKLDSIDLIHFCDISEINSCCLERQRKTF